MSKIKKKYIRLINRKYKNRKERRKIHRMLQNGDYDEVEIMTMLNVKSVKDDGFFEED